MKLVRIQLSHLICPSYWIAQIALTDCSSKSQRNQAVPLSTNSFEQFPDHQVTRLQTVTLSGEKLLRLWSESLKRRWRPFETAPASHPGRCGFVPGAERLDRSHPCAWCCRSCPRQTFMEPSPLNSSMPIPLGDNGKIDLGLMASSPLVKLAPPDRVGLAQWSHPQPA